METLIILHLTDLIDLKATKLGDNTAELGFNGTACIDVTNSIVLEDIIIVDDIEANDGKKYTIVSVGAHSFEKCILNSIKLPHTITELFPYTFSGCTCWNCIDISKTSIKQIPDFCFANCSFVSEFFLPNNFISVGTEAFYNANLRIFVGPESLESLGESTFMDNSFTLDSVDLRKTKITKIPKNCFKNCFLSSLYLPDTVIEIDSFSLYKAGPKEIALPKSLHIIGDGAFMLSEDLMLINIKSTCIERISNDAFHGCTSLKSIEFPETLKSIENGAFAQTSLCYFSYEKNLEFIGDSCFNSTHLSKVNLSDSSVKYIGKFAFSNCEFLTEFIPPKKLETISSNLLFSSPAVTSLTFTNYLKNFEESGLAGLHGVQTVFLAETQISIIPADAFKGDVNLLYINLPISLTSLDETSFGGVERIERIFSCGKPINISSKTIPSSATLYTSLRWNVEGVTQKVKPNCAKIDPVTLEEPPEPEDNSGAIKLAASISAVCFVLIIITIVVVVLMRHSRKVSTKDESDSESIGGLSENTQKEGKIDYHEAKTQDRRHRQRRGSRAAEPSKRLPELAPGIYDVTGGRHSSINRSTEPVK